MRLSTTFGSSLFVLLWMAGWPAPVWPQAPPALLAMAEAERAFSRRAGESTPREAFIEFFADESVSFQPDPGPAPRAPSPAAAIGSRSSGVPVGAPHG